MRSRLVVTLCHFCEVHGPVVLMSTESMPFNVFNKLQKRLSSSSNDESCKVTNIESCKVTNIESCEGCQCFEKFEPGFISMDKSHSTRKPITYVSSLRVEGKEMNKIVEQICTRSISCEQYPGQQGALMYSDDRGFTTFSYKFFLKDFHSRGFKRSYVVNVISADKFFLFNSWLYLVEVLEVVVAKMRVDAENHFNHEHALHSSVIRSRSPTKLPSKPFNSGHLNDLRRERGYKGKQTRSIAEMTNNTQVFEHLHVAFVALLKGLVGRLVSFSVLKKTGSVSEELVDLEKQEETEEGFMKVFKFSDQTEEEDKEDDNTDINRSNKTNSNPTLHSESTTIEHKCLNDSSSGKGGKGAAIGEGVGGDRCDIQVFTHPRVLMKVLGAQNFSDLFHHLLVGHQVIVRAKELAIITSIISCLKSFLPKHSDHLITAFTRDYSTEQKDKLLIGMPLIPLLPTQLSPCLILDVSGVHMLKKTMDMHDCWIYKRHKDEIEELSLRYYMLTVERLEGVYEDESLLEAIQAVLSNEGLQNSLADLCLHSLKQEWINKAKIFRAIMKDSMSRQEEEKVLQVIGAKHKDKNLLKHWSKTSMNN